jgi:Spy/CpxP family protein refolding chaperone
VNYWKVILATVVIFATGVMTGGLLVNYVERAHPRNGHRIPTSIAALPHTNSPSGSETNNPSQPRLAELLKPRLPEIWSKEFVGHLNDALALTPDQRDKIEKIIADGQELNHAIWTNNATQTRKVMQDARQQIREQLTPDQRKQFEELMKRPPRKQPSATNAPAILPLSAMTNAPGV